jgi:photosystem II stability/assembly factor-like uncharacterized protein
VVLAITVLPRLDGQFGPAHPTGSPGPTFNKPAALDARVDQVGLMSAGGIWAVQGSYLLTSTDNGESWQAGVIPTPAQDVFVLDRSHAWAITSSAALGAGSAAGPTPAGQLFVVNRTSDGGRTWQAAPVSGNFACDTATFSFVDAGHGFLMCSVRSSAPNAAGTSAATIGSGTVLRTDDGGASWSVSGGASGLGSQFTAGDASTLWSAPDYGSSQMTGVALYVSRDAGRTWSRADLPDLGSVPNGAGAGVAAGPVFWDPSNGAFAVAVSPVASSVQPAIWFYRTSDGGRSWTVAKEPTQFVMISPVPAAVVGREWAVVAPKGLFSLNVSSDFGASWKEVAGFGMPENTSFLWIGFTDKDHAAATIFAAPGSDALMLSSDAGLTWHAADFGDARARVPANSAQDPVAARHMADDFATMAGKDPPTAWNMLSSYSQRAFGSEPAFEAVQGALYKRVNYTAQVGQPTQSADRVNRISLGADLWADMIAFADMNRAYAVALTFPGTAEPPETLVVAPLSITGDWRVWVVRAP